MPQMPDIRNCILQVISERANGGSGSLQSRSVLGAARERLGVGRDQASGEAILTVFHDLFRTGYLAWGLNLDNPDPPFFHITDQGRKSLANLSRDPGNPEGYFKYLASVTKLNPITNSYLKEAVSCFGHDLPKACAVMVGASSESMVLELRDKIVAKLQSIGKPLPKGIEDWKIKTILDSVQKFIEDNSSKMSSRELRDSFMSYWPAFVHQIRSTRNDAGHPTSVDPISYDTVHASLLIFPELAKLMGQLVNWVANEYK